MTTAHPVQARSVRRLLSPRRRWLGALVALGSAMALTVGVPSTARAVDLPGATVSGTITTSDGGPRTALVQVQLLSYDPSGAMYPTAQDSVLIPPGGDPQFTLTAPAPGYYVIRARPIGAASGYLTTWLGDREDMATEVDGPGVLFVGEDLAPSSGHDIALRRGVVVSGTVRGSDGGPVADATVTAGRWVAGTTGPRVEPIPSTPGALTSATGAFSLVVAAGTDLSLSVSTRTGYRPWTLGGQTETRTDDNSLRVDGPVTQAITLTPDWSGVGASGRIVRDEVCLRQAISGTADLGGLRLDVHANGVIAASGSEWTGSPLAAGSAVPALVPYWSDTVRTVTWGVSGSRLCVIWRSAQDDSAYQAVVDRDGEVTFNYGTIGRSLYTTEPQAGWTEGAGPDGELVVLPRDGVDGYADEAPDGLVHGQRHADLPGRYRFTFTAFASGAGAGDAAAPAGGPSVVPAEPVAGQTLSVVPGTWTVPDGAAGPRIDYQWLRDGVTVAGATRPTLTTSADEAPGRYTVRVTARRDDLVPVSTRASVSLRGAAPTAAAPEILGTPAPGRTLRVGATDWTGGATTTTHQWRRWGVPIPGATGPTYVVQKDDVARSLSVRLTAERGGHVTGRVTSRSVTVRRATSSTRLTLSPSRRTAHVRVAVTGVVPTGRVEVRERGRVVASGRLVIDQRGRTSVRLPRLARGSHRLVAVFGGSASTRPSRSTAVTVVIG